MLEVKGLHKRYGDLVAVERLFLTLHPGDVFGFIGSNGAGKTTTIRMIATLLEPTSGTAILDGVDIHENPMQIRKNIGYMPDFFGLYDDVKVWEYLDFFATIYRIPSRHRPKVIDNVLELTDLTVKKDAYVQSLSRGMQQRLCLAKCLVHDPKLLLLDEPASGLDPRARAELKELILELGRMGKIVVVSSHILPELAGFCNTVGIIEKGRLLAFGPVEEIVQDLQPHRNFRMRVLQNAEDVAVFVRYRPGVLDCRLEEDRSIFVDFQGDEDLVADLVEAVVREGYRLVDFREEAADLEDVFLKLTTGEVN